METIQQFFINLYELSQVALGSEFIQSASGLINISIVSGVSVFFVKYVAPRLAENSKLKTEFKTVESLFRTFNANLNNIIKLFAVLKNDVDLIKQGNDIAYSNSNLPESSKMLIHEILAMTTSIQDAEIGKIIDNLTEGTKEEAKKVLDEVKKKTEEIRKSALQQLKEDVESTETNVGG